MTPWPLCWIKVSRRETSFAKSSCASKMRRAQQRRICSCQSSGSCPFCWSRHGLWNDSVKIEDVGKLQALALNLCKNSSKARLNKNSSETRLIVGFPPTSLSQAMRWEHHQLAKHWVPSPLSTFTFIGTLLTFRHVFILVIFFLCKIVRVLSPS